MRSPLSQGTAILVGLCIGVFAACLWLTGPLVDHAIAGEKAGEFDMKKAYDLYKSKCLACHDSVADPEKPGRTRDGWFVVVNLMHKQGLKLTTDESAMIVELLYSIRRGLEKDPG